MEHGPLVNLLQWHLANRLVTADLVALYFTPLSFDVSFHEIFATWCAGGALVITPEAVRRDPVALLALIIEQRVQKLYLPFVALQQLAQAVENGPTPTTLLEVITAGEQLRITPAIVNLFRRTGAILHNHYGATEIQDVTAFSLTGDAGAWPTLPPIGQSIANTQIYLLDGDLQPVAPGEPGELYVGGACLARGYRNQPELTAARFMAVKTAGQPQWLYKTGDLARYLADGSLEHLGRADQQVKIRGFRVELGEIESQVMKYPAVREAVVVAHDEPMADGSSHKRLLAYVVAAAPIPDLATTLLAYLRAHLPNYMVPAQVVALAQLPLTPSGKVDRRALPIPAPSRPSVTAIAAQPQSNLEQQLARLWCEVLQVEKVGVHDNFFDLGGNSLLMAQVQRGVSALGGAPLPIVTLFQYPTIHSLAQHLTTQAESPRTKMPLPLASPTPENGGQPENKVQQRRDLKRQRRGVPLAPQ